jgi:flagellar P-ring protein precursor FlgI
VNEHFGGNVICQAVDPGSVEVDLDFLITERIGLVEAISQLENLRVVSDVPAKVVINERSGTVVAGEGVRISTVAISHGGISVEVTTKPQVSQPQPLSEGQTTITADTEMTVVEQAGPIGILNEGATIGDLVSTLNAFGVTSSTDMIAIFQALKEAGALRADLIIM